MRNCGIDVSKSQSVFYLADDYGKKLAGGKIPNTPEACADLVRQWIGEEGIAVALETGNLTFILARAMREAGAEVRVVDPYQNALIARSCKKTDKLDAKKLAEQLRLGMLPPKPVHIPTAATEDLRRLVAERARLVKERTALSNKALRLAERYGVTLGKAALNCALNWDELAQQAPAWSKLDQLLLKQYAQRARLVIEQLKELERLLPKRTEQCFGEEAARLRTIPGIGEVTTPALLAQVEDVTRFGSAREFCSYVGLAPAVRQSGNSRRDGSITKHGNGRLRGYLTQAALAVIRKADKHDPLWQWYEQVRRRRGWKKARVALARKLAAICYGVLKHQQPYQAARVAALLTV